MRHRWLMLTVLGGLAGIDCDLIRARNGEGRERAKLRGSQAGHLGAATFNDQTAMTRDRKRQRRLLGAAMSFKHDFPANSVIGAPGHRALKCMDVESWRLSTKEESLAYIFKERANTIKARSARKARPSKRTASPKLSSLLVVRRQLSPVDLYCYLKARFGDPNGFQNFLRKDDSGNWIHWDFDLRAGDESVYICSTSREIHFLLSESLTDENWRDFILRIKADYKRVGKRKSEVLKSFEKWVIFTNKFVEVANICADLHAQIADNVGKHGTYKPLLSNTTKIKGDVRKSNEQMKDFIDRILKISNNCLVLSLLTPVLSEAFINMIILITCKRNIRENERQFDAFIRSHIDTKIFDLAYKCEGFAKAIDHEADVFKKFKRVMDQRNHRIHGNINPEREKIEIVYFEGKRPLFMEQGDNVEKYFETLQQEHIPQNVIRDYEDTYDFLMEIVGCLKPGLREGVWRVIEDPYPGYDLGRKVTGSLFSADSLATATVHMKGIMRYDDELAVDWSTSA